MDHLIFEGDEVGLDDLVSGYFSHSVIKGADIFFQSKGGARHRAYREWMFSLALGAQEFLFEIFYTP